MNSRIGIIILGIICSSGVTFSQAVSFSIGVNYCTFNMNQLNQLHDDLVQGAPVPIKSMSKFPPYLGFEGLINYQRNRHYFGVLGAFTSTGSRLHYQDYSGSLEYNQLIKGNYFGIQYGYDLMKASSSWNLIFSARTGLISTLYTIDYSLFLGDQEIESERLDFESKSIFFSPGLALRKELLPWLLVSSDLRYLINIPTNLELTEDNEILLINSDGPVGANWSGVRITLSVELKIPSSKGNDNTTK